MTKRARKKSWKFSEGGAALFSTLLFLPLVLGLGRFLIWPHPFDALWKEILNWFGILILEGLMIFMMWFAGLRSLIQKRLCACYRTWYEGLLAMGLLVLFFGAVVAISGRAGGKFNSHPVPRSFAIYYLDAAAPFLVVGAGVWLLSKIKGKA